MTSVTCSIVRIAHDFTIQNATGVEKTHLVKIEKDVKIATTGTAKNVSLVYII